MIVFDRVTKDYGHDQVALKHLSFTLADAEMMFLTGHSGAGKSTILKLITAMEPLSQGNAEVNGYDLRTIKRRHLAKLRRDIGIILQDPHLIPHRSVFDNVALPLVIRGMHYREIPRRVRPALDMVGLLDKEKRFPAALSSGEQQRVSIARAIVNKPKLLLADEPTGNLDPKLSLEIMRLFSTFNQVGMSIIIATHDLALVTAMPYRILTLRQGQLSDENTHERTPQ